MTITTLTLELAKDMTPKTQKLIGILSKSTPREIVEAFASVRRSKEIEFEQISACELALDKAEELKRQRRAEAQVQARIEAESEPRRVLQAIYDLQAGYPQKLEKYRRMTPIQLKQISIQIPSYDTTKLRHLLQVKNSALCARAPSLTSTNIKKILGTHCKSSKQRKKNTYCWCS